MFLSLKKKNFRNYRSSDFRSDRDWRILFASFLTLVIAVFFASVYLYRTINKLERISQARMITSTRTNLDLISLERAVVELERKSATFESLLESPPKIVDPSR